MPSPEAPRGEGAADAVAHFRVSLIRRAQLERAGTTHDVLVLDVGLRGVFVEWPDEPLAPGEAVEIRFRLPGNEIPIVAPCRVAWWHPAGSSQRALPAGAGLEFLELADADRSRLTRLLEEHGRRDPRARQFTRWWPDAKSS